MSISVEKSSFSSRLRRNDLRESYRAKIRKQFIQKRSYFLRETRQDEDYVCIFEGRRQAIVERQMSGHHAFGVDMAQVCRNPRRTNDVEQGEVIDKRIALEQQRQWLTYAPYIATSEILRTKSTRSSVVCVSDVRSRTYAPSTATLTMSAGDHTELFSVSHRMADGRVRIPISPGPSVWTTTIVVGTPVDYTSRCFEIEKLVRFHRHY